MRVLCAPDSFKESINARDAAAAMAVGVKHADAVASIDVCPIGDGGEGTLDAMLAAVGGVARQRTVTGPLGQPIEAMFGIVEQTATGIVELAQASGIALIPKHLRDPMRTTTFGTGELLRACFEEGCREVIVFLGGSGTVDGGAGLAQALGAVFYDARGNAIETPMTGGLLGEVHRVRPPDPGALPRIRMACDVTNPLCGPTGAAFVYGPQKGATPEQVRELDESLQHFAKVLNAEPSTPGFGAAGGAALAPVMLCRAEIANAVEVVFEALRFDERCSRADLVLTGEGSLDAQSLSGKATISVAKAAARFGVRTIAIVGRAGEGADRCVGPDLLKQYVSISERFGVEAALADPAECLAAAAQAIVESC